jgi:sterol desaturase/sphingolipid hydroxylase (fatty acid hydroxylase superfamily)
MTLELALTLAVPVTFASLLLLERWRPARPLPRVAHWKSKGLGIFLFATLAGTLLPLLWMDAISRYRLMNLEGLGVALGALVAFVGTQFFIYWWHRAMHGIAPLWRWFHQLHHSAERLDIYGAYYLHPLDVLGFSFVQSVVPYLIFGVRPEAALISGFAGAFYSLFQHTNVRTPRWLGFVIQRPESHSVHHGRGVHAFNYADFPLWDLLFGTFRNPRPFEAEAGFFDGGSRRLWALLTGRKVA